MSLPKFVLYQKDGNIHRMQGAVYSDAVARQICYWLGNHTMNSWSYRKFDSFTSAPTVIHDSLITTGTEIVIQIPGFNDTTTATVVGVLSDGFSIVTEDGKTATIPMGWVLGEKVNAE